MHTKQRETAGARLLVSDGSWKRLWLGALSAVILVGAGGLLLRLFGAWEMPVSVTLNQLHHGAVGTLGDLLYRWAAPVPAVAVTVVLTGVILLISRDLRVASTFAVTIAVTWLSMAIVKVLVDRARPDASLLPLPYTPVQGDASYPSGHAAFLTILAMVLVTMIRRTGPRVVAAVIATVLIAFCGFLLTVDAVHFPTDVAASVVWVLGIGPLVRALWNRFGLLAIQRVDHHRNPKPTR